MRIVVSSSNEKLDFTLPPIKSDAGLKYDLSDLIARATERLGLDLSPNCGTRVEYQVAGETVRLQVDEALNKQLLINKKDLKDKDGVMHLYLTFRNRTGNEIDFTKVTEPDSEELVESKHVFTVDNKWKELNRSRTVSQVCDMVNRFRIIHKGYFDYSIGLYVKSIRNPEAAKELSERHIALTGEDQDIREKTLHDYYGVLTRSQESENPFDLIKNRHVSFGLLRKMYPK